MPPLIVVSIAWCLDFFLLTLVGLHLLIVMHGGKQNLEELTPFVVSNLAKVIMG